MVIFLVPSKQDRFTTSSVRSRLLIWFDCLGFLSHLQPCWSSQGYCSHNARTTAKLFLLYYNSLGLIRTVARGRVLNHWGRPNRLKLSEQINALMSGVTIVYAQNNNSLTLKKIVWVHVSETNRFNQQQK